MKYLFTHFLGPLFRILCAVLISFIWIYIYVAGFAYAIIWCFSIRTFRNVLRDIRHEPFWPVVDLNGYHIEYYNTFKDYILNKKTSHK